MSEQAMDDLLDVISKELEQARATIAERDRQITELLGEVEKHAQLWERCARESEARIAALEAKGAAGQEHYAREAMKSQALDRALRFVRTARRDFPNYVTPATAGLLDSAAEDIEAVLTAPAAKPGLEEAAEWHEAQIKKTMIPHKIMVHRAAASEFRARAEQGGRDAG